MSDFEIHDRQQHAQGTARSTDALPPSVRGSGRRSASARHRLIPYGADFQRQSSGARWRAAVSSRGFCRVLKAIGLDRRDHEGRSIALRGILVSRGVSRVCARYLGAAATPVGDLRGNTRSGITRKKIQPLCVLKNYSLFVL